MAEATGAPTCGAETVLIDWETWDADKVERMGRAFQRNVCHLFLQKGPTHPGSVDRVSLTHIYLA